MVNGVNGASGPDAALRATVVKDKDNGNVMVQNLVEVNHAKDLRQKSENATLILAQVISRNLFVVL